jgi:AcrR family transcriptional regulator
MARKAGDQSGNTWQWSRTAQTRQVLLDAAHEVFSEQGYSDANVTAVVERAGSSVGSLYHHFGGKAELYLALWEEYQASQETRAAGAVSRARADGMTDALELLIVGARAYLEGAWQARDLVPLFRDGDGPPGFELRRRARERAWLRQTAAVLRAGDEPADRMLATVLTTVISEASREVAGCQQRRQANLIIDIIVGMIRRLAPEGASGAVLEGVSGRTEMDRE